MHLKYLKRDDILNQFKLNAKTMAKKFDLETIVSNYEAAICKCFK